MRSMRRVLLPLWQSEGYTFNTIDKLYAPPQSVKSQPPDVPGAPDVPGVPSDAANPDVGEIRDAVDLAPELAEHPELEKLE